jgi:outer membrane lipoprotein-sorting protein
MRLACSFRFRRIICRLMRWPRRSVALWLGLTWLGLGQVSPAADDPPARERVDRVARLFSSQSSIATVEMQIAKEDWQRQISMQFWSLGESNILVRIRRPPEDAGTAILKVGSKIWYYLPKAHRTVTMPAAMMTTSWMGSHFTLNDLVKESRLTNDYVIATTFEGQRDGVAESEYTLTPKPAAVVVWGKITLEIRQADGMPVRQRYYDEDGKLVRELTFSEYKTVSGRLIPTRLVMKSMDKTRPKAAAAGGVLAQGAMRPLDQAVEQTTITYQDIAFDVPIHEGTFSLENLKP